MLDKIHGRGPSTALVIITADGNPPMPGAVGQGIEQDKCVRVDLFVYLRVTEVGIIVDLDRVARRGLDTLP